MYAYFQKIQYYFFFFGWKRMKFVPNGKQCIVGMDIVAVINLQVVKFTLCIFIWLNIDNEGRKSEHQSADKLSKYFHTRLGLFHAPDLYI